MENVALVSTACDVRVRTRRHAFSCCPSPAAPCSLPSSFFFLLLLLLLLLSSSSSSLQAWRAGMESIVIAMTAATSTPQGVRRPAPGESRARCLAAEGCTPASARVIAGTESHALFAGAGSTTLVAGRTRAPICPRRSGRVSLGASAIRSLCCLAAVWSLWPLRAGLSVTISIMTSQVLGLIAVNTLAAAVFAWDKWVSPKTEFRRVFTTSLVSLALFGGWPLMLLMMHLLNHKTSSRDENVKFLYSFFGAALVNGIVEVLIFYNCIVEYRLQ